MSYWRLCLMALQNLLQEHHAPIKCGVLGGFLIGIIGILLPPTMFWGEFEINTLANPTRPLAHIWPQGGVWGTEVFLHGNYGPWIYLLIGFVKLVVISITVLSGKPLHYCKALLPMCHAELCGMPALPWHNVRRWPCLTSVAAQSES